jgi:16S rRNA processing protein RimM
LTLVTAGRIGKPHGHDGSFYVDGPRTEFVVGRRVWVRDVEHELARADGTPDRPLVRIEGVDPAALRGELLLVDEELEDDEYLAADLVGCEVPGLGLVERVIDAPSCALLEVGEHLIPLIGDAVKHVDLERKIIDVDRDFLGY